SVQAILTGDSREIAAAPVASEALVVWSTATACYVALVHDAAHGESRADGGACHAPHVATTERDVGLVFERDGGIYFARADAAELTPHLALRVGDGHDPRVVAVGDRYVLSYVDPTRMLVVGFDDHFVAIAADVSAHDLTVLGGLPRVATSSPAGL